MQKRGQVLKYFLILMVIVLVSVFGFKAITMIQEASFRASLVEFRENLKTSVTSSSSQKGSVNEESYRVPKGVEKIYFVDNNKNMTALFESLEKDEPIVKDAVASNSENNVFLVKGGKVVDSFYAGQIELNKPYFVCTDSGKGNMELFLGGTGISTEVVNQECNFDCTFEVVAVDPETARSILENASEFGCNGCPTDVDDAIDKYFEKEGREKIARRCNCGREPGQAVVEIIIKPEKGETVGGYTLIERIPKSYLENINDILESMEAPNADVKVKSDPLIMWHFSTPFTTEQKIKYVLNADVFKYCGEALETIGYEEVNNDFGALELPALDLAPVEYTIMKGTSQVLFMGKEYKDLIWEPYIKTQSQASASMQAVKNEWGKYAFELSSDGSNYGDIAMVDNSGLDFIKCEKSSNRVLCTVGKGYLGTEQFFYARVKTPDGRISNHMPFKIIASSCIDLSKDDCGIHPAECDWCTVCDGPGYNGYGQDKCVDKTKCMRSCEKGKCGVACCTATATTDCTVEPPRCCDVEAPGCTAVAGGQYYWAQSASCVDNKCIITDSPGTNDVNPTNGRDDECEAKTYAICRKVTQNDEEASTFDDECAQWDDELRADSGFWDAKFNENWINGGLFHPSGDSPYNARYYLREHTYENDEYSCYEDFVTSCMQGPTCPAGYDKIREATCSTSGSKLRYKYSKLLWVEDVSSCDDDCITHVPGFADMPGAYQKELKWHKSGKDTCACYSSNFTPWHANPSWPQGNIFKALETCTTPSLDEVCDDERDNNCDDKTDCRDDACQYETPYGPCPAYHECLPNGVCQKKCTLDGVSWDATSTKEQNIVKATVIGDLGCDSSNVDINILRSTNEQVLSVNRPFVCSSGICTATYDWKAEWKLHATGNLPQTYSIKASVSGSGNVESSLVVEPITKTIGCIDEYTTTCKDSPYEPCALGDAQISLEWCGFWFKNWNVCQKRYPSLCQLNPYCNTGDTETGEVNLCSCSNEVCDGKDNDCDGGVDEGLTAPDCEKTKGVCAGSKKICGGTSEWLPCSYGSDYQTTETTCDGKDNDCDGETDEGVDCGAGKVCVSTSGCVTPELEAVVTPTRKIGTTYYFDLVIREKHGLVVTFNTVYKKFLVTGFDQTQDRTWISQKCGGTYKFSTCSMIDRSFGTSTLDTQREKWNGEIGGNIVSIEYDVATNLPAYT